MKSSLDEGEGERERERYGGRYTRIGDSMGDRKPDNVITLSYKIIIWFAQLGPPSLKFTI